MTAKVITTLDDLKPAPSGAHVPTAVAVWFSKEFPNGATAAEIGRVCPDHTWLLWFAFHLLPKAERKALAFRFAGQAVRFAARACVEHADDTPGWEVYLENAQRLAPALSAHADNVGEKNWLVVDDLTRSTLVGEVIGQCLSATSTAVWGAHASDLHLPWAFERFVEAAWAALHAVDGYGTAYNNYPRYTTPEWLAAKREYAQKKEAAKREQAAMCAEALSLEASHV